MGWLDGSHKIIRAHTERQLNLKVAEFIADKSKKGEMWAQDGSNKCTPARLIGFKKWSANLERTS